MDREAPCHFRAWFACDLCESLELGGTIENGKEREGHRVAFGVQMSAVPASGI
jgi:hypothetical protein